MGLIFGIRWLNDLYVAGLCGLEKQVQYNIINVIIISLQYIGGWVFLKYFTHSVLYYFIFFATVALLNLLCNTIAFYRAMPKTSSLGFAISFKSIKKVLPLALGSSYSSLVWVFVTESDKLIFSHILPLAEYGYFSLLVIVSAGVRQFSAPILQAILPRLTYYVSNHQREKMLDLYCKSTNLICILVFSVVACVVLYPKPLLYAWSGSMAAANFGAPILVWYVLSSALLSVGGLQYSLQVAHGSLKLHAWYNTIAACIKIPLIVFIAFHYGVYATAITWFVFMVIGFFVWVPIVHHRYAKNMHFRWLKNVLLIFLPTLIGFSIVNKISFHFYGNHLDDLMKLFVIGVCFLACLFLCVMLEAKLKWIE